MNSPDDYYIEFLLGVVAIVFLIIRFFGEKLGLTKKNILIINIFLIVFLFGVITFLFLRHKTYVGLFAVGLGFIAMLKVVYDKMKP